MVDKPDNGGARRFDDEIERGIDALDKLRVNMRAAGMAGCADALDEVFVKCLKDYVDRREAAGRVAHKPGAA